MQRTSLKELAGVYLRLGLTSFGGPAAHIAIMEDEIVLRRRWLTHDAFVDLIGATNLIPGPNSTEMAIHVGYMRSGFAGLVVAGASFILPSAIMTGLVAWLYRVYGALPIALPFIQGIQSAVIAIIGYSAFRLGRTAVKKSGDLMVIGAVVFLASLLGTDEVLTLFAGGILGGAWLLFRRRYKGGLAILSPWLTKLSISFAPAALPAGATVSLLSLFLMFLKVGAVLYGSGYVLIALLHDQLVQGMGWLTEKQLLDAIAVGQFTPGPVLSTATFIGFQIHGLSGAITATVAVFLPSFVFVAIVNPIVPKLRRSLLFSAFLDAVNVSSVGLIAEVAVQLGRTSLNGLLPVLIFVAAAAALWKWNINSSWIVLGGGMAGLVAWLFR